MPPAASGSPLVSAYVALLLVQLFFGTFPVLGKIALREVSPLVLAAIRAIGGAVVLSLLARWLEGPAPRQSLRERLEVFALALCGIVANQLLFITGLARTTATHATVAMATIPVFTIVAARALGLERPSGRRLLALPVAFAGVASLLGLAAFDVSGETFAGDLLVVTNAAFYAFYLAASRRLLARRAALGFIAQAFRYGAVPILLLATPSLAATRPGALSAEALGAIAAIVALPTIGAYALNTWALSRTSASTTAFFTYIQPLFAAGLAAAVLGERLTPGLLAASALIFGAVALAVWPEPRRAEPPYHSAADPSAGGPPTR